MPGLYVQLDVNWPDNDKVAEAGVAGAGAHAIILCLAKRLEKDGWVGRVAQRRYGIDADLIDRLVLLELVEIDPRGSVRPWDWHSRNPSQAAIDARRASKAEAGKRGNHAKHKHGGEYENCPICKPDPLVVAGCEDVRSQALAGDNSCGPSSTKQSESRAVVAAAIAPGTHVLPVNELEVRAARHAVSGSPLSERGMHA